MFKKINTTTLLIILIILGGLVAFNKFYLSKKSDSTFNDVFVHVDSSKITQFLIYPKAGNGKEVKITREGKGWALQNAQMKTTASGPMVQNLLMVFTDLKSLGLAANDKSSWKEYQVDDSTGSRIKILTSDGKTYDMVIGKFGYNQATRNGVSYARHSNEDAVYAVNGFLSFAINKPFNDWRDRTLVKGNKDDWSKLTFSYPGDSSFVLSKQNNTWMINKTPADSVKVMQYLGSLSNMQGGTFAEPYTPVGSPVFSLTIEGSNQSSPISVTAYPSDSIEKFILHSSLNTDAWFNEGNSHLMDRIFVSPKRFVRKN
jgi:hypothetical protein